MHESFDTATTNAETSLSVQEFRGRVVHDMRPGREGHYVRFDGTYASFVNFTYLVRCNLFHGRKNVDRDENDSELVQFCYSVLHPVLEHYLDRQSPSTNQV